MTLTFTVAEKIEVVDNLIESLRWTRSERATRSHVTYLILKAIAADLRGRAPEAAGEAQKSLYRRIEAAKRANNGRHYDPGMMFGIAEELIGRWATVEQALERFGESQ